MGRFLSPIRFALLPGLLLGLCARASANPGCFGCQTVGQTFTEELKNADVVAVARLTEKSPPPAKDTRPLTGRFEVAKTIKGDKLVSLKQSLQLGYYQDVEVGTRFLIMANKDEGVLYWHSAMDLSPE